MSNDFQTARWYDAIYANIANYPRTAEIIESIARRDASPDRLSLLDVACGTGRLIEELLLRGSWDVQGLDLDSRMLAVARERLPNVTFHEQDMVEFDLGQMFDVITCLGSSLPAVGTRDRLTQAIYRFAQH
ncbi:MAG: class I SAM-dependent methyltransferase, partial [Thermomicrobiales bacterium]